METLKSEGGENIENNDDNKFAINKDIKISFLFAGNITVIHIRCL